MSEKKIVFINQASGYLTIDIINAFVKTNEFEQVALISGIIREQDIAIDSSVRWSKINLYDRRSAARKFFTWLTATFRIYFLLLTKYRKFEIFYITIPPFAYLLSLVLPNRFSVLIFDVYPDVLSIYGVKETNFLYRRWVKWNNLLFSKAYRIYTIAEGMKCLVAQYVNAERIHVIHNWSGLTNLVEEDKQKNPFIKENELEGKFIVQYSGNIGYTHNTEILLDIANVLVAEKDLVFVIIGRGEKFYSLQERIKDEKLQNCLILPFQPDHLINYSLGSADLGVVILDEKTAHVSIPSKIYNLQAVGVPLLCIASLDSEIARHVDKYQNGKCFTMDSVSEIASWIIEMKNNSGALEVIAKNSKNASKEFTIRNADNYAKKYITGEV
ncbi:glycosyltransferase family 4 protein [uncultured Imperialibacter sp.]|uniref:glycosyltransferase family 4 protein n=1 Tax=uncultured Imperialibacter sp. TaxID=1672639 RepID=UPI0030DC6501|tara:strand:+ start:26369 stop:27523 length:1155 start_codon:yes stop_codon:yes gene_type:complete